MNTKIFLACDGSWSSKANGTPICNGSLQTYTSEELTTLVMSKGGLSIEDANQLLTPTLGLFASVFVILLIKKALS